MLCGFTNGYGPPGTDMAVLTAGAAVKYTNKMVVIPFANSITLVEIVESSYNQRDEGSNEYTFLTSTARLQRETS